MLKEREDLLEYRRLEEEREKDETERIAKEATEREQQQAQEVDSQPRTTILQPLSSTTTTSSSTQVVTTPTAPTWLKLNLERKKVVQP